MNKKLYKAALLAALGLASVSSVRAETYGDLIFGITTGSGTDELIDLGSVGALPTAYGATTSWNLTSLLTGINLSTAYWGVLGDASAGIVPYLGLGSTASGDTLWSTTAGIQLASAPVNINEAGWANINIGLNSIVQNFPAFISNGYIQAGNTLSIGVSDANSWYSQTENSQNLSTTAIINTLGNPNIHGTGTEGLWQSTAANQTKQLDGTFTLNGSDQLIYEVPEPGSLSLIGGAGMLALFFRNQLRRKQS